MDPGPASPLLLDTNKSVAKAKNGAVDDIPHNATLPAEISNLARPSGITQEEILNSVLKFLSTADAQSLGAVAVGLSAVTYFILGRIGLVLIGAFGGVVLFISWQRRNPDVSRALQGEKSVDVLERLLDMRKDIPASGDGLDMSKPRQRDDRQLLTFEDFQPETAAALNELVDAITRDYVKWWYTPIVPADKAFPLSCRKTLTTFIVSISQHMSRKRPADAFLDLLTNSSSIIIVFFGELANAFADVPADSGMTAVDAIYSYLASKPECHLANLLSQKQQASKFRMISEDLLAFLDRATYDCDSARVFLREILAGVILEMTLQTCSKPEWINGWIVYLLEAGEPDFNQAIDVGMQTGTDFGELDGNSGNTPVPKAVRKLIDTEKTRHQGHSKKLSRSVEETEEAMEQEAKKLNRMMVEEDAKRTIATQESIAHTSHAANQTALTDSESNISREQVVKEADGLAMNRANRTSIPESPAKVSSKEVSSSIPQRNKAPESPTSPVLPRTTASPVQPTPAKDPSGGAFTSFDQFVPQNRLRIPTDDDEEPRKPPPLTLHSANITIYDDNANDKGRIRTKPTWDYLVQVEPASSHHPGWMIVRKYVDFEALHEILRRIANVSGASGFTIEHGTLPHWKVHTRESLRSELERYVRDACSHQPLAESEGMKRFFEKSDQGHTKSESKSGFGIEAFGKNMLGALTNAPKGALEGSKAVVGGVSGVLGNIGLGQKKSVPTSTPTPPSLSATPNRNSMPILPRTESLPLTDATNIKARDSMDSQHSSIVSIQPGLTPMGGRPSDNSQVDGAENDTLKPRTSDTWGSRSPTSRSSRDHSRASSLGPLRSPSTTSLDEIAMRLPPRPNDVADDYSPVTSEAPSRMDSIMSKNESFNSSTTAHSSPPISMTLPSNNSTASGGNTKTAPGTDSGSSKPKEKRQFAPLSEAETRIAVELVFTMINELYSLSSAWNVRRAILMTGKSFLLRPGNPSLAAIRAMIQDTLLACLSSDSSVAGQVRKGRENVMPTEKEREGWAEAMTQEEKEKLRVKARRLMIESGVPTALTGVMGQAATGEAVGRVFDALQIEEVARGLVFGVMLQAMRILTH